MVGWVLVMVLWLRVLGYGKGRVSFGSLGESIVYAIVLIGAV